MLKKIFIITLITILSKSISFKKRLNSKKCIYTLEIENLKYPEFEDYKMEKNRFILNLIFKEKFILIKNENTENEEKIINEKRTKNIEINLLSKYPYLDEDVFFENYDIMLNSKILYFKNLGINMSKNNFVFTKRNVEMKFFYQISNLPCDLELPLARYSDFTLEGSDKLIMHTLEEVGKWVYVEENGNASNNLFMKNTDDHKISMSLIFDINSLNKFHLEKNGEEIEELLKKKNYDKFRSFTDKVV